MGRGQGELKYGPPRLIGTYPQPTPMMVDYGLTDRQTHPDAAGFGGVKGFEDSIEISRVNASP